MLLPSGEEVQIGLYLDWPLSNSGHPRLDGGHSETPRQAGDIHPLSGREKDPPTQWGAVVDCDSPMRGLCLRMWIQCAMDAPFRITVRVDMQVCLRMIAAGRH